MAAQISVKQGATLQLLVAVKNNDNTPFDLTSTTFAAEVRTQQNRFIDTLNLTTTNIPGQLLVSQQTASWPVGLLYSDFKFTSTVNGTVLKTDTFTFQILQSITS